jgi:Flp pilus assembly protein TadG
VRSDSSFRSKQRTRGSTLIEITLLAPWIFFMFVFVIDMGFYTYALISVQNAVRVGAEYTSGSTTTAADQSGACTRILAELGSLPNLSGVSTCSSAPLTVTAVSVNGTDGAAATTVTVTYQGLQMIPIPGFLTGQLSFTRTVQMRVKT